jgi:hypothetical protein
LATAHDGVTLPVRSRRWIPFSICVTGYGVRTPCLFDTYQVAPEFGETQISAFM